MPQSVHDMSKSGQAQAVTCFTCQPALLKHPEHACCQSSPQTQTATPPSCIKTIPHYSHSVPTCHPTQRTLSCQSHTRTQWHALQQGCTGVLAGRQACCGHSSSTNTGSESKQVPLACMQHMWSTHHRAHRASQRTSKRGKTTPQTATDRVPMTRAPLPARSRTHTTQQL